MAKNVKLISVVLLLAYVTKQQIFYVYLLKESYELVINGGDEKLELSHSGEYGIKFVKGTKFTALKELVGSMQ